MQFSVSSKMIELGSYKSLVILAPILLVDTSLFLVAFKEDRPEILARSATAESLI